MKLQGEIGTVSERLSETDSVTVEGYKVGSQGKCQQKKRESNKGGQTNLTGGKKVLYWRTVEYKERV